MFGRYEIGEQPVPGFFIKSFLGAGSFGSVYAATGPGGSEVAIKRINLQQYGDKELRALRLVKRIRHPNVVPLTGFWLRDQNGEWIDDAIVDRLYQKPSPHPAATLVCTDDGTRPAELIVVMGLADMSLEDRLRECQREGLEGIPADELLRYMDDAARAIDFLNKKQHPSDQGLVAIQHCDIKPQNILIVGGAAQVCDLGLARILDDARQTRAAFTAAYGAPECMTGSSPSSGTDQYSLAISYVELRTGQLPFEDPSSHLSVIQAHVESRLDLKRLPSAERAIIRRATSKNPSDRYETAQSMVSALRLAVAAEGSGVPRETKESSSLLRNMFLASMVAGAAVGIGLFVGPTTVRVFFHSMLGREPSLATRSAPDIDSPTKDFVERSEGEPTIAPKADPSLITRPREMPSAQDSLVDESPANEEVAILSEIEEEAERTSLSGINSADADSEFKIAGSSELVAEASGLRIDGMQAYRSLRRRVDEYGGTILDRGQSALRWNHLAQQKMRRALMMKMEQRGREAAERGRDEEAIEIFSQLIQADRDHVAARIGRGLAYARLGNLADAQHDYSHVIEQASGDQQQVAQAYRLRGIVRAKQSDWPGAEHDLTAALDRGAESAAHGYRLRSLVKLQQGHYQDALQDAQRLSEMDSGLLLVLPLRVKSEQVLAELRSGQQVTLEKGRPLRLLEWKDGQLLVAFQADGQEGQGWVAMDEVEPAARF